MTVFSYSALTLFATPITVKHFARQALIARVGY